MMVKSKELQFVKIVSYVLSVLFIIPATLLLIYMPTGNVLDGVIFMVIGYIWLTIASFIDPHINID